jgi:hypothetical protein
MLRAAVPTHPHRGAIRFTDHDEYIFVQGSGCWTPTYVDTHFTELASHLTEIRTAHRVCVLLDLAWASVQSTPTADRIRRWMVPLFSASDRVAIIVESSLAKAQMRRVAFVAEREFFLTKDAALAWLLATAGNRVH